MLKEIEEIILHAESKALATFGPSGLNVVPVSSIRIETNQIWLFNFFLDKTLKNIQVQNKVSLVCWSGTKGVQIKGLALHETSGARFQKAKKWIEDILPDRILKGVLVINPEEIFDVSIKKHR